MALLHVGFVSYTLVREVDINIVLPTPTIPDSFSGKATHAHKAPYPVLYLLHGYGNNYSVWGRYTSVERYAEERNIVVVMLSGENKGYRNTKGGEGVFAAGDRHFDFISKELPEFINSNFPVSTRPEDTYIAGLSMGSNGTILHSLSAPERFSAAGCFSGPEMQLPRIEGGRPFDVVQDLSIEEMKKYVTPEIKELVEKAKVEGKKFPKFYVSSGLRDNPRSSEAFAGYLEDNGIEVTTDFSKDYGHEWQCWDENIKEFLDWIPRTDAYAGSKRKI